MTTPTKGIRKRNLYDPKSDKPYRLSRSRLENFLRCARCFYLDRRLGVDQPSGFPFNLNSAVDHLLKCEFDEYRAQGKPHPLMVENGIDALPYRHERLDEWRENFKGVTALHGPTNLIVTGAVDDLWVDPQGRVIVVDYKATSKNGEVTLDAPWQISYKRQMEIYQWLLRRNGLDVFDTGYFVYCNGRRDTGAFNARLDFTIKVIPYEGDDSWVETCVTDAHACLSGDQIPPSKPDCGFCRYRRAADLVENR